MARCTQFCSGQGSSYAAIKNQDSCICGRQFANDGLRATDEDCEVLCEGEESQRCGESDRYTLYAINSPRPMRTSRQGETWVSIDCLSEEAMRTSHMRQITSIPSHRITVSNCTTACQGLGYKVAGVRRGNECYCSKESKNQVKSLHGECGISCVRKAPKSCGGSNLFSVYSLGLWNQFYTSGYSVLPTGSETASLSSLISNTTSFSKFWPTSSVSNRPFLTILSTTLFTSASVSADKITTSGLSNTSSSYSFLTSRGCSASSSKEIQWGFAGCFADPTHVFTLSNKNFSKDDVTLNECARFCTGHLYFGIHNARQCSCSSQLNVGAVRKPDSECSMLCSGLPCTLCGAADHMAVYNSSKSINRRATTSAPSPTNATTPRPPKQTESGFPAGWQSFGCCVDGVDGRILSFQAPDNQNLTLESCAKVCADLGYSVAGAEYFTQCFCGNQIINGGARAKSLSECNTPCRGKESQNCGGPDRMSIMSLGEPQVFGPPQTIPMLGKWNYSGCYEDNVNQKRTFSWQIVSEKNMTPSACVQKCGDFGYMAASLEYGIECYCGDPVNIQSSESRKFDDKECNIPCSGNGTAICGGRNRLSTYFWKGDPFYSWTFPPKNSPDSGVFEFLIGGVCIPLMTSQSITGKVTFLEKWGTGRPNSTGAYELDLTKIGDMKAAWRTMHVKTDIFCSARVTLPDKSGRQLTIGGWSGDSTFGVRLYNPDGSPGVPGKNDWQENSNVLKLQNGRWYPTAMVMANGSVLVIGGQDGSNGAPVPTLELLPNTGTKPMEMDWSRRTNPNTLYPFACVLPSGGILVVYWNEARILDENTFSTIKTLPQIPGAVNDEKAGRTYPLEGVAVLLPQRAPYKDPLGILICGGSNEGPSNALDNCVSTYPDAAKPTWTLERMPSPRVMPCIVPLPDGTYLIVNGAHHGVAGFGLAVDPNLNALLYDPSKPIGHRITVMANTTIARMYHSEAITLLDGRVLISGSDPQDGVNPQEYRVETFTPPYLLNNKTRPTFNLSKSDWSYNQGVSFTLGTTALNGAISVSMLGAVTSTHGNSIGARTLFPQVTCAAGVSYTVVAPPDKYVAPPGWYQLFVLDSGIPSAGVFMRIGGDPGALGNWPKGKGFTTPGV